jgi:hypothetical protein
VNPYSFEARAGRTIKLILVIAGMLWFFFNFLVDGKEEAHPLFCLVLASLVVGIYVGFVRTGYWVLTDLQYGKEPEYWRLRQTGFHPFWDNRPKPRS